jgi:hypothetical protein
MAQQTDEQLRAEATVITTETTPGANTANRVGTMFTNSIDSKINNDVISADTALGTSDSLIPTQNAVKVYADGLVVGLLDDRGNFTPGAVVGSSYPTTGGSGTGGAIRKGDLWFIDAAGYLNTTAVSTGTSVRALVDNPGALDDENWNILNTGFAFTPENVANKSTNVALGTSNILYPTQNAVRQYVINQSFALTGVASDNIFLSDNTFNGNAAFNGSVNINNSFTTGNFPMSINGITGTAGQILTSQGGAAAPTWETNTAATLGGFNTFTNSNQFNDTVQFNEEVTLDAGVVINSALSAGGGVGTTGQVLTSQGNAAPIWANAGGSSGWSLTGNAGTTPGTNFIGTTDSKDLVFKTNNSERLRITTGGNVVSAGTLQVFASGQGAVSMSTDSFTKGSLTISNGTASGKIQALNLTASRTYQLPDDSGTLALTKPEYRIRIYQSGTSAPVEGGVAYIDTITIGTPYVSTTWRYIEYLRISTGTYILRLIYNKDQFIDYTRADISFSDNKITNGQYSATTNDADSKKIEFTFYRYDFSGTLIDGINWSNVYLKLW